MKKGMELILAKPFKAKYNIAPKSAVTSLQASQVGSDIDLKNQLIRVSSFEEIFAIK
ncbi:hypothetical protein [Bacillus sp. T3]|uniref:hypothetical protein n=1 Tax=Bacillus sp. T3 TaxID=467262 RepID=UPI002981BB24|nr:hypothetical protein [Bacillus sp. T3]